MIEIRAAKITDLPSVAQLVALSFHPGGGWQALWRSFVRWGIEQDLRDRWHKERPHYHCWLAVMPKEASFSVWAVLKCSSVRFRVSHTPIFPI